MALRVSAPRAALLLVALLAFTASAQDSAAAPWSSHVVQSARLGAPRTIYVATPDGYRAGAGRYPVLVVLDANDRAQFDLALASAAFLANRGLAPGLIVVGIPNGPDRTHDLTPPPTGRTAGRFATAGGSSDFAGFVVDEVLPAVRARYRTLPGTLLAGHSFGGLFALEVAARRPNAFAGIIAMSPAMWWNDSSVVADYADAIAASPVRRRLFVTSGGLEPEIDRTTRQFVQRLEPKKPERLGFAYRRYPDDTHMLTPAPSLADGLRFLFEDLSLGRMPISEVTRTSDSASIVRAVLATEAQYRDNAHLFGLVETPPESYLASIGRFVLREIRNTDLAIWILARNATLHPDSPTVYQSLGDAYMAKGDQAEARIQNRRALEAEKRREAPVGRRTPE